MTIWSTIITASAQSHLAERFRAFAALECGHSPLYRELATHVAGDADLLALATTATNGPVPNLFLAAVHDVLMRHPDADLAAYYATLTLSPRPPAGAGAALTAFAREHSHALEGLLRSRLVQTNEVRRALALYLAVGWLMRAERLQRIALVEVGCSAGLLLAFDRYAYRVGPDRTFGFGSSALVVEAEVHGSVPEWVELAGQVVRRMGVDLNILNLDDPDDRRWLRALVWGDRPERLALLDRAVEVAREVPMTLHEGDANELLPGMLAGLDPAVAPVVFHSHALNQFPAAAKERFERVLERASERRVVYRIAMEYVADAPHIELLTYDNGALAGRRRLACYDAHGAWVQWLAGSGGR